MKEDLETLKVFRDASFVHVLYMFLASHVSSKFSCVFPYVLGGLWLKMLWVCTNSTCKEYFSGN